MNTNLSLQKEKISKFKNSNLVRNKGNEQNNRENNNKLHKKDEHQPNPTIVNASALKLANAPLHMINNLAKIAHDLTYSEDGTNTVHAKDDTNNEKVFDIESLKIIRTLQTDTKVVMGKLKRDNSIALVSFRGTASERNIWTDLQMALVDVSTPDCKQCKMHEGFSKANLDLDKNSHYGDYLQALVDDDSIKTVIITGHSLGGALAITNTFRLITEKKIPINKPIFLLTFGAPRSLNANLANFMNNNNQIQANIRFVYNTDIITTGPLIKMGYKHTGTQIQFLFDVKVSLTQKSIEWKYNGYKIHKKFEDNESKIIKDYLLLLENIGEVDTDRLIENVWDWIKDDSISLIKDKAGNMLQVQINKAEKFVFDGFEFVLNKAKKDIEIFKENIIQKVEQVENKLHKVIMKFKSWVSKLKFWRRYKKRKEQEAGLVSALAVFKIENFVKIAIATMSHIRYKKLKNEWYYDAALDYISKHGTISKKK